MLQGRLILHLGVTNACNWLTCMIAVAMALIDSGQRPRLALLRLGVAGGAALTRVRIHCIRCSTKKGTCLSTKKGTWLSQS